MSWVTMRETERLTLLLLRVSKNHAAEALVMSRKEYVMSQVHSSNACGVEMWMKKTSDSLKRPQACCVLMLASSLDNINDYDFCRL